jgi:hypothetical protein
MSLHNQLNASILLMFAMALLRSLGHAQHLLHDMAQPQHTRDDWHAGTGCIISDNACLAGKASFYERYLEARVSGSPTFSLPTKVLPGQPQES